MSVETQLQFTVVVLFVAYAIQWAGTKGIEAVALVGALVTLTLAFWTIAEAVGGR